MHVNRSGRVARLILIVGLICFVLVGLIIRPASALTANPAAVCVGLDCTVTFGPADEVYEWVAPAGSSKIWVQLEGSQDEVSGARGDLKVVSFWMPPRNLTLKVSRSTELAGDLSVVALDGRESSQLGSIDATDPYALVQDEVTPVFASFLGRGEGPAGVGHAIVHYKQAAVQSPAPAATATPTPTATATPTPAPEPAAVLPSPPSDAPTSRPSSEPTPEPPTVESIAVVAVPVVESPRTPVVVESPVAEIPTPEPVASTTDATDTELVIPYFAVPIESVAKVASDQREAPFSQRVIQVFSNPRAIETEETVSETPAQIKAEPSSSAWVATSLELAAISLSGAGVILGVRSARRRKLAAHRKRFRLVTAFS